jgi:hypothetical protein
MTPHDTVSILISWNNIRRASEASAALVGSTSVNLAGRD